MGYSGDWARVIRDSWVARVIRVTGEATVNVGGWVIRVIRVARRAYCA